MGRRPGPTTRVQGVYKQSDNTWEIRYFIDNDLFTETRQTRKGAEARAELLKGILAKKFDNDHVVRKGCPVNMTRGAWITVIWDQIQALKQIDAVNLLPQATDAIVKAYKAIREDLEVMEHGLGKPEDPSAMDEESLDRRISQLKAVQGGKS